MIESHLKSNYSAIYSYIRSVSNQNVLPSTLHLDDIFAVSDSEKASLFNKYFHSVVTRSSFQLPPFYEMDMPSTTLSDICISELDVFRVLRSLDITKAKGCDGISPKLLKICALSLYQPLHHLFSLSLSQKYLPLEWRTHLIKPIFKSGDKSSIRNYRPISLFQRFWKSSFLTVLWILLVTLFLSLSLVFYEAVPPCNRCLFSLTHF